MLLAYAPDGEQYACNDEARGDVVSAVKTEERECDASGSIVVGRDVDGVGGGDGDRGWVDVSALGMDVVAVYEDGGGGGDEGGWG